MTVTVYSKPNCVQCGATYRLLDREGIPYEVVDVSKDPEAMEYVTSLGHMQAPVVVAGEDNWAGFQPDKIKALSDSLVHG